MTIPKQFDREEERLSNEYVTTSTNKNSWVNLNKDQVVAANKQNHINFEPPQTNLENYEFSSVVKNQESKSYETPIKIQSLNNEQNYMRNSNYNYEIPVFIHKNEKLHTKNEKMKTENKETSLEYNLQNNMNADINNFITQLGNASDRSEKIEICILIVLFS
jgi:hypothetical protein